MKLIYLIIILITSGCATYKAPQDILPQRAEKKRPQYRSHNTNSYRVKKGDSLWRISKQYGISVEKIMKENNISSSRNIKPGQLLRISSYDYQSNTNLFFFWPVKGEVVNFFGENINNVVNRGLNIRTSSNENIKASAEGRVIFCQSLKNWGKTLILKHGNNFYTIYANLQNISVNEGDYVSRGDNIGIPALWGKEKNCVLHFEIRKQHLPQDPLKLLR